MATFDLATALAEAKAILAEESGHLKEALTPERKARLELATVTAVKLAARAHAGEDVKEIEEIIFSVLLDYKAVAAMALARTAERVLARGCEIGARYLAAFGRGLLAGAMPGAILS